MHCNPCMTCSCHETSDKPVYVRSMCCSSRMHKVARVLTDRRRTRPNGKHYPPHWACAGLFAISHQVLLLSTQDSVRRALSMRCSRVQMCALTAAGALAGRRRMRPSGALALRASQASNSAASGELLGTPMPAMSLHASTGRRQQFLKVCMPVHDISCALVSLACYHGTRVKWVVGVADCCLHDNRSCVDIHCGMLYAMFHTLPTCAMILTQHCSRPSPKRGPAHAAHAHACYNATHGCQLPAICGIGLQPCGLWAARVRPLN